VERSGRGLERRANTRLKPFGQPVEDPSESRDAVQPSGRDAPSYDGLRHGIGGNGAATTTADHEPGQRPGYDRRNARAEKLLAAMADQQ
jgi:hypothetical protein